MSAHAERKLATVLFADLIGSTAAAEDQDPERTRARLERFYEAMAEEIEAAGGTVEKFVGDAVMAAFGAPGALEDHAERALHAALSMQRRLSSAFGGELTLRIGVNTGEVVVGRARADSSFVSGDAVNVAARLEQAAGPGEILAGERTVYAARGAFEFSEPSTVPAKGKAARVSCRKVVRAVSLMRSRGVGGLARAFVGREDELQRLRAAFDRAVEGRQPVVVTLVGDAGVGKTRLMRELWEELAEAPFRPMLRTGRCLAYGKGSRTGRSQRSSRSSSGSSRTTRRRRSIGRSATGRSSDSLSASTSPATCILWRHEIGSTRPGSSSCRSLQPRRPLSCSSRTSTGPNSRSWTWSSGWAATWWVHYF